MGGIDPKAQRLSFCGKVLVDKQTLNHYKIDHESNVQFSLQTSSRKGDDKEDSNARSSDSDNMCDVFSSPEVNWDDIAKAAKSKVDKLIEYKKTQYDIIVALKRKIVDEVDELKKEIEKDLLDVKDVEKDLSEKDEEMARLIKDIALIQEVIRGHYETILDKERIKLSLSRRKEEIKIQTGRKQSRLNLLLCDIANLDENIKRIIIDEHEIRPEEKEKAHNSDDGMKEFLNDSISAKKAMLECPVCYETASPPIHKCPREHLTCSECLPKMNHKCPSCRASIPKNSYSVFRIAEEIWVELQTLIQKLQIL